MTKFIREHFVVVIGATLPLIVILLFGLATVLPGYFVESPKYDLLFMTTNTYDRTGFILDVVDGKLQAQFSCFNNTNTNCLSREPGQKLFEYEVKSKQLKEIPLRMPVIPSNSQPFNATPSNSQTFNAPVSIPELANVQIDTSTTAPDGYQFNVTKNNGDNIFNLFGSYNYRNQVTISKNGYNILIPYNPSNYYYYEVKFIGWIIAKGA